MSIAGIGGLGAGSASQMLSVLLSRLDQQSSSTMEADDTSAAARPPSGPPAMSGGAKPSLSSMVLGALIGAQAQSNEGASAADSTSAQDPVQSLFSAMDGDGDGTVSQAEMETYIQSKGGTQSEADTLYGMLTQNGTTSLTEEQLAAQAPPPPSGPEGARGRHGHHPPVSAAGAAEALTQALDADGNGAVDQNEMEGFVTANGGTAHQADTIFASLDSNSTGAIGSADFASAIEKLQANISSGSNSPMMRMLNAFARMTSDTETVSVSA